jgi:hypothetical protein
MDEQSKPLTMDNTGYRFFLDDLILVLKMTKAWNVDPFF